MTIQMTRKEFNKCHNDALARRGKEIQEVLATHYGIYRQEVSVKVHKAVKAHFIQLTIKVPYIPKDKLRELVRDMRLNIQSYHNEHCIEVFDTDLFIDYGGKIF